MDIDESTREFLIDRLAEEFAERCRRGERPTIGEYAGRYPELADRIRAMLPMLVEGEQADAARRGTAGGGVGAGNSADAGLDRVGDYQIVREIGRGGMGVVYEAEQLSLGRRVALKILPLHVAKDGRALERFRREARSAAKLHHTNIVPVFEVGQEGDVCYYAMQFIQGQGLDQVIAELRRFRSQAGARLHTALPARHAPTATMEPQAGEIAHAVLTGRFHAPELEFTINFPVSAPSHGTATSLPDVESDRRDYFRSIARIVYQAATALAFAHERGIIHRDIKPSNLLLDTEGVVWITDFGLAKAVGGGDLTHSGDVVGTIRYMAPERFRGEADALSDVYSLGLTLYELLVLRPAFDSPDHVWLVEQVKNREPIRVRAIDPRIPRDLETIVLKAIDKDLRRRYASADDLAEDLHRFLEDEPIKARQISVAGRMLRWSRRNTAVAVSLSIIATLLIAGVIGSSFAAFHFREQELSNARLAREAEGARRRAVEAKEHEARLRQEAEEARSLAQSRAEEIRKNLYHAEMNLAGKSAELPSGFRRVNELLANWRPVDHQPDLRGWEFYYLDTLGHRDLLTLRGHFASVVSVCWSPDRGLLASASTDSTVRVWEAGSGQQTLTLRGHAGNVWSVAWSPDGAQLASAGEDATILVRAADTGRESYALRGHAGNVWSVAWSPDGARLASAGGDATVRVWRAGTSDAVHTLRGHAAAVRSVAWSPDGTQIASAGDDATIRVWHPGTEQPALVLRGHAAAVRSVAWSPDGASLASASWDGSARIWSLDPDREPLALRGHASLVESLAWSPDGTRVATAGEDGTVRVWDAGSGREQVTLRGHTGPVNSVGWDREGERLASASWDETIKVWSADQAEAEDRPTPGDGPSSGPDRGVLAAAWSPDGTRLASVRKDGTIELRAAEAGREVRLLHQPPAVAWVGSLAWSPDGARLASAGGDAIVRVWDAGTGREALALRGHAGQVTSVAWSPDGARLATGGEDAIIRVWDAGTGREALALRGHSAGVGAVAWSPDGTRLASGSWDMSVIIWEVAHAVAWRTLRGHFDAVRSVCWSPDGTRLASTGDDATIKVWEPDAGRARLTLRGHFWRVWSVAWNPDGGRLASASIDATVRVWEVETGQETLSLRKHAGPVRSVAWSPDGLRLASAGDDGMVLVEDATRGCMIERSPRLRPLLDRRIAADPRDPDAWSLRGDIQARLGRWDDAAADLAHAFALRPQSAPPWFPIGWWVIGPYTEDMQVANPIEIDPDPFRSVGGAGAAAGAGAGIDTAGVAGPAPRRWKAADPEVRDYLDFGASFDHAEHISAYAWTRVYSPRMREVVVLFGADDTARLWLNGKKIYESLINRSATPDQDAFLATLDAGWNTLLVRVSNMTAAHALFLRLSDAPEDRVRALLGLGRHDEAATLIEDVRSRGPDRPRLRQLAATVRRERRQHEVAEGRWARLAAGLAGEIDAAPDDPRKWFHGAVAQLAAGRTAPYRQQCLAMLRRFAGARDWVTAERISKVCLLAPDDPSIVAQAAQLAVRGLDEAPDNPWTLFAAGLAAYRTGAHASAIDRMRRGRELSTAINPSEVPCYQACTLVVQAMAHARLDQAEWARQSLDQADRLLEGRFPAEGAATQYPSPWPDWALCQILWREAVGVVRGSIVPHDPRAPRGTTRDVPK